MNGATINALTQELLFIKTAEIVPTEEPYKSQFKGEMWRQFVKNVGQGALGAGLGWGAAEIAGLALPKLFRGNISPERMSLLSRGAGLLAGLGSMATMSAYNEAQRRIEQARERDQQRLTAAAGNPAREEDVHERE